MQGAFRLPQLRVSLQLPFPEKKIREKIINSGNSNLENASGKVDITPVALNMSLNSMMKKRLMRRFFSKADVIKDTSSPG